MLKGLRSHALPPLLVGIAIAIAFVALNHSAYDGFFQDDELDTLKWAPASPAALFLTGLVTPKFQSDNFRPVGHLYFALMGNRFRLHFPPYMTPIFAIHLLNALLLWLLMRKLGIKPWCAIAAAAFFTLSVAAFDAYWKPMYVFDLLCTTFCLASVLLYSHRRWVLSFIAFWLAYKAKELAVILPAILAAYEYWFGERKFRVLIPFVLAGLSFGIQGVVLNPNKDTPYTLRFTLEALSRTAPFYAYRFLMFPLSGFLLFALALVRDRRAWFGLLATLLVMVPLLFLPGRLFEAYTYLPLAVTAIALAAAASHTNPLFAWIALAIWLPFNLDQLHREKHTALDNDDQAFAYVDSMAKFVQQNPSVTTLVYDGVPPNFHHWGVTGAWNIIHRRIDLPALFIDWPETAKVLAEQTVAYGNWNYPHRQLIISLRSPKLSQGLPRFNGGSLTRRCLILTAVLWLCFLTKLLFYSSFVPLWEGYDEFAHFAFDQYLTENHKLPPVQNTGVSREVAESLRLAPVPWTIRQWTPGWIAHDDFWRLPEASRQQRERELKQIPRTSAREQAPTLRLYEAQQPPLAYLLYSMPYAAFQNADLLTRAWVLRLAGSAIVSLVIPLGFIVSRRILRSDLQAVGAAAVLAAMPELMMLAGHAGNEPLAIVLGTACVYGLCLMAEKSSPWRALLLGSLLGCALLTKSYFLTLIPVVLIVVLIAFLRRRIAIQLLITVAAAIAIAGWWYGRAITTTGTLTTDQISIAARANQPRRSCAPYKKSTGAAPPTSL